MTHLIKQAWQGEVAAEKKILLPVDRHTLAKRRWHAVAPDGLDFGFDLETPLRDGDLFFATGATHYLLAQQPEPVLEISLGDPVAAARTAWSLGNLHFPIEIASGVIRVVDDTAVRLCLEREHLDFHAVSAVFHPSKIVISHGHTHAR